MATTNASAAGLEFRAPAPGTWLLDSVHMPRPFSRFQQAIHAPGIAAGCRDCFGRYGLLVDHLDFRFVHGLAYFAPVPAPQHEIPARFEAAERAVAGKIWRADLDRWLQDTKPASIRAHLDLQRVDPNSLGKEALVARIEQCIAHLSRMVRQHHSLNAAAILPLGDFMASVAEWTGQPLGAFLAILRGAAPESAGAFPELDRLVAAVRQSRTALDLLASAGDPGGIVAGLRSMPGEVGAAATGYLDIVSYRLLDSLDTADRTAIEMPEVLLKGLRFVVDKGAPASSTSTSEEAARLRDLIPDTHRAAYDELLGEARLMSRLRDERGLYSDVWAAGIARRALLAAGSKLADQHRLHEPAHLIEGDPDEIRALLANAGGPSADELAERSDSRAALRAMDAPPFLGEPPHPPPPLDGLPPAVARLMRALGTAIDAIFAPSTAISDSSVVRGTGASPGRFSGTARVVGGPADFGRLQRGDVLVTSTTTESFNIVLPLLGAIVTDTGGLLSHSAIVCREYGIPGVVGCLDATSRIADGSRVVVDGGTGEVQMVSPT